MRILRPSFSAILFLLLPLTAAASNIELSGQSRSYLMMRETADATRLMPFYEYLNFTVDGADTAPFVFDFGGWYRYDLRNESPEGKRTGDLQYANLRFRSATANASVAFGRILINEGALSEQIDGIHGRTDLKAGFTVAAFGGIPVETRIDTRSGDTVIGGRIAQGKPGLYAVGISVLDEKNDKVSFRKERGVDLWVRPVGTVELQGMSLQNAIDKGWSQHQYLLSIGPFANIRLIGEASKIDYKKYFDSATLSAFMFPSINPDEKLTSTGGSLAYQTGPFLASVDYKTYDYSIAGTATSVGGRVAYSKEQYGIGATTKRMKGETDRLTYDEVGAYVTAKIAKADISLQAMHVSFKEAISGVTSADNASAAAGITFAPEVRIVADVEYAKNPDFNRDVRSMFTLVYNFDAKFERKPPVRKLEVLPKKNK